MIPAAAQRKAEELVLIGKRGAIPRSEDRFTTFLVVASSTEASSNQGFAGAWTLAFQRVVQKLQFLNNFRQKTVKCGTFCQDLFDNQPGIEQVQ
jgi:hypothetical protein